MHINLSLEKHENFPIIVLQQSYSTPRWQFALYAWDCKPLLLSMPLACRHEEFTKCTQNHAQPGPCGAPMKAGQMMDANFLVAASSPCQPVQQFRIDHRSTRLQWMLTQKLRM